MPGKKKKYNARFPPARIKKIMQTDEEVGKVAAPVPVIISRALELFAETLLSRANDITTRRGARTLTPSHLKLCIETEGRFDFLRELVTNVPDLQEEEFEAEGDILPLQPRASKPRGRGGIQAGGAQRERKSTDTATQIPGSTQSTIHSQYTTQLHSNTSTQSMARGVGRKRGRPPKANGSNGPGRLVEKRKYVDNDDDDDVQVIGSSDDDSRESNGVIVANPIFSRGAESSAVIQINPEEIRPSSFSSHSFHPSLQHSISYSNSHKVTPSGQFPNLVSLKSCDTPAMAALARVSCLSRSLSSPAFSGLPSGRDNKVGLHPGNNSDRKLLNTEDEIKKSSGPSFSSDGLSSTNMSNGPSSTPTSTTSVTNGPKNSIGIHTHGTTSITDSGFYTSTASSQSSISSSVSQVSSIYLKGSNGFSTITSTTSNPGLNTMTPGALTTHSRDDKTGTVALTNVIIQPLIETSPSFTLSSLETSNLHKSSITGGSNFSIPGGSNFSIPGGSNTSIPGGSNSSISGGSNTLFPGGSNTSTCEGSSSTNLLTSTSPSTAQETCPRGLPLLDSGSHSFIRSLSSAQLSSASQGSGSRALAVKSKPLIRRDVVDEDYD